MCQKPVVITKKFYEQCKQAQDEGLLKRFGKQELEFDEEDPTTFWLTSKAKPTECMIEGGDYKEEDEITVKIRLDLRILPKEFAD